MAAHSRACHVAAPNGLISTAKLLTVRMEKALAKVKFEGLDAGGDTSASEFEEEGNSGSEEERETRLLVTKQNRKGKKSGGFQSMGALAIFWNSWVEVEREDILINAHHCVSCRIESCCFQGHHEKRVPSANTYPEEGRSSP